MKKLITSLALALTALSGYAITPLWMRDARISPDGTEIVFCYKGDIYKLTLFGRPTESRLHLPATGMGILTSLSCLPMAEPLKG